MIKKKRHIAMITIIAMCIAMIYISPTVVALNTTIPEEQAPIEVENPENAVTASVTYSETYTYATINVSSASVLAAPVSTADAIDTLSNGHAFNIIYREYDYYYIQYAATNGVVKRGYILRSATNTTVGTWCQYPIYRTGYNKTNASQPVYHTYYSGSAQSGTIYATEGETANSTLIVLCGYNNKYLIQYITNTSNNGSQQIKWKRGWVDPANISLYPISKAAGIDYAGTYYIQNVQTGKYLDVPSYKPVDGANMHTWEFHGGYNQEWKISLTGDNSSPAYVTFSTCQDTTKVLAVKNALAVKNTNIDLAVKGNPPSKDQEFYIEKVSGSSDEYYIYSRLTGKCLQVGTDSSSIVYNRYPYVTGYNRWRLIPVYVKNVDYKYWNSGIPSSTTNGVHAKFDISRVASANTQIEYGNHNYTQLALNSLNLWSDDNRKFSLTTDVNSPNKIFFKEQFSLTRDGSTYYGALFPNVYVNNPYQMTSCNIEIYYNTIIRYYSSSDVDEVWTNVLTHELGHAFGLDDLDNEEDPITGELLPAVVPHSVMSYGRTRTSLAVPHNCDIAGVKKHYMD